MPPVGFEPTIAADERPLRPAIIIIIIIIIIIVVLMKVTTTMLIKYYLHKLPHVGCGVRADMLREDGEIKIPKLFHSNKSCE